MTNLLETNKDKDNEFSKKDNLLKTTFKELTAQDFYYVVYGKLTHQYLCILSTMLNKRSTEGTYRIFSSFDLLMDMVNSRRDAYMPAASFKHGGYCLDNLRQLFAFVVDIDNVSFDSLSSLVERITKDELTPTLLVNSGNGVHIYYVLDMPHNFHHKHIFSLNKILKSLKNFWDSPEYKVDYNTSIIQTYRVVGSLNKFGKTTKGYLVGKNWSLKLLAQSLKVNLWEAVSYPINSPNHFKNNLEKFPNGDLPFYNHCLKRVPNEVAEGNRYLALYALAIVAYKCRVSYSQMASDIASCAEVFNRQVDAIKKIKESELPKAFKGYSQKYLHVNSKKLEEYFGFKFPRNIKRNGRKRHEHLENLHEIRQAKKQIKAEKISQLIQQGYSKKDIADIVGMSLQNLYVTYKYLFHKP